MLAPYWNIFRSTILNIPTKIFPLNSVLLAFFLLIIMISSTHYLKTTLDYMLLKSTDMFCQRMLHLLKCTLYDTETWYILYHDLVNIYTQMNISVSQNNTNSQPYFLLCSISFLKYEPDPPNWLNDPLIVQTIIWKSITL